MEWLKLGLDNGGERLSLQLLDSDKPTLWKRLRFFTRPGHRTPAGADAGYFDLCQTSNNGGQPVGCCIHKPQSAISNPLRVSDHNVHSHAIDAESSEATPGDLENAVLHELTDKPTDVGEIATLRCHRRATLRHRSRADADPPHAPSHSQHRQFTCCTRRYRGGRGRRKR